VRRTTLTEWKPSRAVPLSADEVMGFQRAVESLSISPSTVQPGCYDLTPKSEVGVVRLAGHELEIRPKLPIDRLLFLISYSLDPKSWRDQRVRFGSDPSLLEAIIPGFVHQANRALGPGVLQGYRSIEAAESTVRGRLRFEEQIRRRHGRPFPVEVQYDEFTVDIEVNRLIKAAVDRLSRLPIRADRVRSQLHHIRWALSDVSLVEYAPQRLPEIRFTRLNERYRAAVALAKLILQATSLDLAKGGVVSSAFLMDMNAVFEDFVVVALRETLGLSARSFPQGARSRGLTLDRQGHVGLEPDISWWDGDYCRFVGDVKYKRTQTKGAANADVYQLVSYAVGANLARALVIYAAGEIEPWQYDVRHLDVVLDGVILDPSGEPEEILERVAAIGRRIRAMATETGAVVAT